MKKAFTLAEVLITLGIIGVVAAITLPSVINNTKNKERLESSYDREQYSITLDSQKTSEIKKYNKDELNKGGYFDWKTMDDGESSFIDKYFDKKRNNIVGDNS